MQPTPFRLFAVWAALLATASTVYSQPAFYGPAAARVREAAVVAAQLARTAFPFRPPEPVPGRTALRAPAPHHRLARSLAAGPGRAPASPVIPTPRETPSYRHTFRVLAAHPELTDRYDGLILKHARLRGLDARLVKSIVAAESEFSPSALSPRGARGLMQVVPATAAEMGVPGRLLGDPESGIRAGTAYLDLLYRAAWRKYKLKGVAYERAPLWLRQRIIAAYNAGPTSLTNERWRRPTRDYVRKVLLYYESPVTLLRR